MTERDDEAACGHDHPHDGHDEIDCQRLSTLLTEYVEGDLPSGERSRLEEHLHFCPPCVAFLGQYKKASTKCRQALLERVPGDLEERLVSFLRKRCRTTP